jgi:hypothetical protein
MMCLRFLPAGIRNTLFLTSCARLKFNTDNQVFVLFFGDFSLEDEIWTTRIFQI